MNNEILPPKWTLRLLHWYCRKELVEEIEGDLLETYNENIQAKGRKRANLSFVLDVFRFVKPFAVKRKKGIYPNHLPMVKNYIIVAYRSLIKKMGFSLINIFGLSVGITCCMLIMMYVQYETSYDGYHNNGENVYRLVLDRMYPDRRVSYAIVPHSYPAQMVADFPEVTNSTRVFSTFGGFAITFRYEDRSFNEGSVLFADSNVFDLITAEFISGDPENALKGPSKIILTESTAKKYFGNEDPIGKSLRTDIFANGELTSWLVTGVIKDCPANSHMRYDMIGSIDDVPFIQNPNWMAFTVYAYVELVKGADPEQLEAKFPGMVEKYAAGQIQQATGQSYKEYTDAGHGYRYYLQPIKDIHLTSNLEAEMKANSSWNYIYILISIATFILVIACINFMNLSTARSSERAKEVGLRKVLGSLKKLLIYQFLTESVMLSVLSTVLSIALVVALLPFFNGLTGVQLELSQFVTLPNILIISSVAFVIGVLAGFYPAFVLSGFTPVAVLKGKIHTSAGGRLLRNGLVTFQFAISIVLISSTLIIFNQMEFIANKSLGFESERVVVIENTAPLGDQDEVFRQELLNNENVVSAAFSGPLPGDVHIGFIAQLPGADETQVILNSVMDENSFEALNIPIIDGRNFSRQFNDSLSLIVNETAVKTMGFADPIGQRVGNPNPLNPEEIIFYTIIGVVSDYHFQSLHNNIGPLVFGHSSGALAPQAPAALNKAIVKIKGNPAQTIQTVENTWNQFMPNAPFDYYFLDTKLDEFYTAEKTSGRVFTVFTSLAIIIACVGLFGLAAYTASLKVKEIGVRKVLGASVIGIVVLLSKEFTKLILVAMVIAIPTAYFGMDLWLQDFAYRISINPMSFVIAGAIAILIGWLTVGFQSFKAAIVNPVQSLRSE